MVLTCRTAKNEEVGKSLKDVCEITYCIRSWEKVSVNVIALTDKYYKKIDALCDYAR